jgi:hypothetical protein
MRLYKVSSVPSFKIVAHASESFLPLPSLGTSVQDVPLHVLQYPPSFAIVHLHLVVGNPSSLIQEIYKEIFYIMLWFFIAMNLM